MNDKARHLEIARSTGSWTSWVDGPWFTNRMMFLRAAEPFARACVAEFSCSCPEEATHDATHRSGLDIPCAFLDWYGERRSDTRERGVAIERTLALLADVPVAGPSGEGDRLVHAELQLEIFRLPYPDGTWAGYQARYVDTANRISRPDRWDLRPITPPARRAADALVGVADGEIVAAIMPVATSDSRYGLEWGWPGSGSRDGLPGPLEPRPVQPAGGPS